MRKLSNSAIQILVVPTLSIFGIAQQCRDVSVDIPCSVYSLLCNSCMVTAYSVCMDDSNEDVYHFLMMNVCHSRIALFRHVVIVLPLPLGIACVHVDASPNGPVFVIHQAHKKVL